MNSEIVMFFFSFTFDAQKTCLMQVGTLQELKDWDFSNIIAEAKERMEVLKPTGRRYRETYHEERDRDR